MSKPPAPRPVPGPLKGPECETCQTRSNLYLCPGCSLVYYCSLEHLESDYARHKDVCQLIATGSNTVGAFLKSLRDPNGRVALPLDCESLDGNTIASNYVDERMALAYNLLKYLGVAGGSRRAVLQAAHHQAAVMKECQFTPNCFELAVPTAFIRLGQDRVAYNLLMLSYLAMNADEDLYYVERSAWQVCDPLEAPSVPKWLTGYGKSAVPFVVDVLLVKIRILFGMQEIQKAARALNGFMMPEILSIVREFLGGDVVGNHRGLLTSDVPTLSARIKTMKEHIMILFFEIQAQNPFLFRAMVRYHMKCLEPGDKDKDPFRDGLLVRKMQPRKYEDIVVHPSKTWTLPGPLPENMTRIDGELYLVPKSTDREYQDYLDNEMQDVQGLDEATLFAGNQAPGAEGNYQNDHNDIFDNERADSEAVQRRAVELFSSQDGASELGDETFQSDEEYSSLSDDDDPDDDQYYRIVAAKCLQQCYAGYAETPGAMELIHTITWRAVRDHPGIGLWE